MIETITARNGQLVFKYDGRLLSSSVDPSREANDWIYQQRELLQQNDRVVILGFGSGYHFVELLKQFPKHRILAIGLENELLEKIYELHRSCLQRIEFVVLESCELTLASARVRNFMRSGALVLEHPSTRNLNYDFYSDIKRRLLAREPLLFADWVRREPRLVQLFPLQSIPGGEEVPLLNIKDLNRLAVSRSENPSRDVLIMRTLRELIK